MKTIKLIKENLKLINFLKRLKIEKNKMNFKLK